MYQIKTHGHVFTTVNTVAKAMKVIKILLSNEIVNEISVKKMRTKNVKP